METVVKTDRLILREFTDADLSNLVKLDSDPDVMRWINGGRPTPRDKLQEHLAWYIGYHSRFPGYGFWAAVERSKPKPR